MAFSKETMLAALKRSRARCECKRSACAHYGRCGTRLTVKPRNFNFHHRYAESLGGKDSLSNCEVLCLGCHHRTQSYGRH